jgi:hypothetical protein
MLHSIINNNNNNEQNSPKSDTFSFVNESLYCNGFAKKLNIDLDESSTSTYTETIKGRKTYVSRTHLPLNDRYGSRYNLRSSKQNTPELN